MALRVAKQGDSFYLNDNIFEEFDQLPVGNYTLQFDPKMMCYYLKQKEAFHLPKRVYGDHSIVNRWLTSFEHNSEKNMGVILSGLKGTGKTITAQKLCIKANLPVIMIGDAYHGPDFIDFLSNPLLGKCIIFIDEFEKIYAENRLGGDGKSASTDFLSLMDGNFQTKLLFLLTVNEFRVNEYIVNRLNRVKYRKDYTNLPYEVINEVIDDLLVNKEHKESIFTFLFKVNMCTFDILVNIIKEMNLFNEDAIACGMHLNLKAESRYFNVYEVYRGNEYECEPRWFSPSEFGSIEITRKKTSYISPEDAEIFKAYSEEEIEENDYDDEESANNIKFHTIYENNCEFVKGHNSYNEFFLIDKSRTPNAKFRFVSNKSSSLLF